jgi:hypothetical protein
MINRMMVLLAGCAAASLVSGAVWAQTAPDPNAPKPAAGDPPAPPATAPAAPATWASGVKFTAHIEGGATFNPVEPDSGVNFGHLFTDKPSEGLLNQVALTLERDVDPASKSVDIGFKLQGYYGSDARYTHFIGELDNDVKTNINQFDVVEANITIHTPFLFKGGIDTKFGQFSTPLGEEVIDPTGNFFYSHSYIFNFGIPLKHTGILSIAHVSPMLDLYVGSTTGVNTSIGKDGGYNDHNYHFLGGFGLNLGKLTVLALTHIGPEDLPGCCGPNVNVHSLNRYLSDVLITYKFNDKLTSITELNYIRDDGFDATGGGVAQYITYVLTPEVSLGIRGEVWRDNNGFFVAAFPENSDFINASRGLPNSSFGGGVVTYGAVTVGMNFKAPHMPKMLDGLVLRPEIRYDRALAGADPFNGGTDRDQFTFGIDGVLPIAF